MQAGSTKYVLRKKPPGKVLSSAHAVEREFQVTLSFLCHSGRMRVDLMTATTIAQLLSD